ncbi:glycosyltransferase family 4 protein [Flavobacterium sp. DG2-3]|uniref:glycosyltransferase family 4 protein n=1 Tax=Flavobacterium sp. DG2-3 TaxID=3068317 RepID=UPI00273D78AF|nr:glycosyltransferase family 4 protein [Flavobacterium sp. DG2-3]MDP5199622.1 glycosyltransferase family 4 protein [Flavobacterium sp. DG2-3]
MKVLMVARKTLNTVPGGDTVQINNTAKYLREFGIIVDLCIGSDTIDYSTYDLIHFFNIIRPDDILPHILKSRLPFIVSTIFVDYSEFERNRSGAIGLLTKLFSSDTLEYAKTIARFLKNGDKINSKFYLLNGHRKSVKYIADKASLLLPNSHSEYIRFVKKYNVKTPYLKIPNSIDLKVFNDGIIPNENFKNHILCVGRIEGLKNQLNLIKALRGSDLYLTIIGKPAPNHLDYYKECKKIVEENENMQMIDHVSHKELAAILKASKVHVLPSWFETTGLISIEAAVMDCNIVITRKGDTEEYFKDFAFYCEPDDVRSIKNAVLLAYSKEKNNSLKDLILAEYVWEKTAQKTLKAYNLVLNK